MLKVLQAQAKTVPSICPLYISEIAVLAWVGRRVSLIVCIHVKMPFVSVLTITYSPYIMLGVDRPYRCL